MHTVTDHEYKTSSKDTPQELMQLTEDEQVLSDQLEVPTAHKSLQEFQRNS